MLLDDEMKPKYKVFTFSILLFCSVFGFSQSKSTDSVWVSVYKKDTNKVSYSSTGANYSELFYRNIQVPVYASIKENEH